MANGVTGEIENLMRMDVIDFWTQYDIYIEKVKESNARSKNRQK